MTIQPRGFDFLKDVDVRLTVELGRTEMKLKDVLSLGEESVVMLDRRLLALNENVIKKDANAYREKIIMSLKN